MNLLSCRERKLKIEKNSEMPENTEETMIEKQGRRNGH